jgi:hypothetical protein
VITNLDELSPPILAHWTSALDIECLESLLTEPSALAAIADRARVVAANALGWQRLVARITAAEMGGPVAFDAQLQTSSPKRGLA